MDGELERGLPEVVLEIQAAGFDVVAIHYVTMTFSETPVWIG